MGQSEESGQDTSQAHVFVDSPTSHGLYAMSLDDHPILYLSGYGNPEEVQLPLFQSQNLGMGDHSILVVNENAMNATSGAQDGDICEHRPYDGPQ